MKYFASILLFLISAVAFSQPIEKIIYDPFNPTVPKALRIGNNFFMVKYHCYNTLFNCDGWQVMKMNQDLEIIDSIDLSLTINNTAAGADLYRISENKFVFPATDQQFGGKTYLFYLDTNLNLIDTISFIQNGFPFDAVLFSQSGSDIIIGGALDQFVHLEVWDSLGNLLEATTLNTRGVATKGIKFNGKTIVALMHVNDYYIILDSNYNIDSVVTRDAINTMATFIWDLFQHPGKPLLYGIASAKADIPALITIGPDFGIIRIDTFTTNNANSYVLNGSFDFAKKDSIYLVAGESDSAIWYGFQPGMKSDKVVYNIDTSGTVNFRVNIGDGKYYLPESIVRTEDGGAVIFSLKYDWDLTTPSQTVTSIIRIDNQGNVITEREISYAGAFLRVFPNPATDKLQLAGLAAHTALTAEVYNLNGQKVMEEVLGSKRELSVHALPSGTYLLHLINEEGERVVRKFVRE